MLPDVRKSLKRFTPCLIQARDQSLNEADTVMRLCRLFEEVLGYDGMKDISREANLKSKYVDVCIKIDDHIELLVEAKAAGVPLRDQHIDQAQGYAAHNGITWVLLTNGIDWHLYHLTFDQGVEYETAFRVSLDTAAGIDAAADQFAFLHKSAIKTGELEEFWKKTSALSPASLGKALFNETIILLLRREIRRRKGLLIDPEDLAESLYAMLSQETRDIIGPMRIKHKTSVKKKPSSTGVPSSDPAVSLPVSSAGGSTPPRVPKVA